MARRMVPDGFALGLISCVGCAQLRSGASRARPRRQLLLQCSVAEVNSDVLATVLLQMN